MPNVSFVERLVICQGLVQTIQRDSTPTVSLKRTLIAASAYPLFATLATRVFINIHVVVGGCCKLCGSVEHLKSNCPEKSGKNKSEFACHWENVVI